MCVCAAYMVGGLGSDSWRHVHVHLQSPPPLAYDSLDPATAMESGVNTSDKLSVQQ